MAVVCTLLFGITAFATEPFFEGLGSYSRKITTDSPRAQRYFNQGLAFVHGFNHGAAIRSFQEAARLDPKCAMAHWAIALACGPHINLAVVPPAAADLIRSILQLRGPFVDLPEAGHHPMLDQPLPLVSALRTLLEFWSIT